MKDSFDKMVAHAQMAKQVVEDVSGQLKNAKRLGTFFHIRPTTNGVTLVSTLPYAPMRTVPCRKDDLKDKLLALDEMIPKLTDDEPNVKKMLDFLETQGIKRRAGTGSRLDDVKAAFITEMNQGQEAFGGIQFLTSDIIVPHAEERKGGYRFNVIGYSNEIVYLIEIRRSRSEAAFMEMDRYVTRMSERNTDFKRLMGALPLLAPGATELDPATYQKVQGLVVMPEAENTRINWQRLTDKHNVDTWFYRTALSFRKLEPAVLTDMP